MRENKIKEPKCENHFGYLILKNLRTKSGKYEILLITAQYWYLSHVSWRR
jgi:hypothetical protein